MLYCSNCDSVYTGTDRPLTCPLCRTMLTERSEKQMESARKEDSASGASSLWGWGVFLLIIGAIGYVLSAPKMDVARSVLG